MKYGKNLSWFLSELANADSDQIVTGSVEIIGMNEHEQEGSIEVEITDLAQAASKKIDDLEAKLAWLLNKVGVNESGVYFPCQNGNIDIQESLEHLEKAIAKA